MYWNHRSYGRLGSLHVGHKRLNGKVRVRGPLSVDLTLLPTAISVLDCRSTLTERSF